MQYNIDNLLALIESGAVKRQPHTDVPGLWVWCYTTEQQYSGDWSNPLVRACRGLVTTNDGIVVSRPYPKFLNHNQPGAYVPHQGEPFTAHEKADGTLIILGQFEGRQVVNTKGSSSTWHSDAARAHLKGLLPVEGTTALFELITPDNRIVIDYQGFDGLVLLGALRNDDVEGELTDIDPDTYAEMIGWWGEVAKPARFHLPTMLKTITDPENGAGREGYVLKYGTGVGAPCERIKLKFASYIALHAAMTGLTSLSVWEALKAGTLELWAAELPDEVYGQVSDEADRLVNAAAEIVESVGRFVADRPADESRRDFATAVMSSGVVSTQIAFMLLDGQLERAQRAALDMVRPTLAERTSWRMLR